MDRELVNVIRTVALAVAVGYAIVLLHRSCSSCQERWARILGR